MDAGAIQLLVAVLSLLAGTAHVGAHRVRVCPGVPSSTAKQACAAVCGTRHMRRLCLRTLHRHHGAHGAAPAARYAGVAARSVLGAYDATVAAARQAVLQGDERVAYAGCVEGYEAARRFMARVADGLAAMASPACDTAAAANLEQDCTAGLRGMDACSRSLLGYRESPLYGRNVADRNKTMLAALLCTLVAAPPPEEGGSGGAAVHA